MLGLSALSGSPWQQELRIEGSGQARAGFDLDFGRIPLLNAGLDGTGWDQEQGQEQGQARTPPPPGLHAQHRAQRHGAGGTWALACGLR